MKKLQEKINKYFPTIKLILRKNKGKYYIGLRYETNFMYIGSNLKEVNCYIDFIIKEGYKIDNNLIKAIEVI